MSQFKVTCFNEWTNKSKVRTVEAQDVLSARCSHKAVSNVMMANGWVVTSVEDMSGVMLYKNNIK